MTNLELSTDCRRVFGRAFASLHCPEQVIECPNSHVAFGFQALTNLGQGLQKSNTPQINYNHKYKALLFSRRQGPREQGLE